MPSSYNRESYLKYKENNPEHYSIITCRASAKWREKNAEFKKESDRIYKRQFREFQRLRNIDIF